jgi:hypothetical protein
MSQVRSSRRLASTKETIEVGGSDSDESMAEQEEWGREDGLPPPKSDLEWKKTDDLWRKFAVNKYVFFRWSTAFNSKNKFKGIVTDHASRIGPKGVRIDFLTIKTFGFSEDRYRIGKDIRELFVLPNKTSLMEPVAEEELKARAIRKWNNGWTDQMSSESSVSTQASTPRLGVQQKPPKMDKPVVHKKKVKLPQAVIEKRERGRPEPDGIYIECRHGRETIAGSRLGGRFSFFN